MVNVLFGSDELRCTTIASHRETFLGPARSIMVGGIPS